MCDHDTVKEKPVFIDAAGNDLPFLRLNVGGVEGQDIPNGDIVGDGAEIAE